MTKAAIPNSEFKVNKMLLSKYPLLQLNPPLSTPHQSGLYSPQNDTLPYHMCIHFKKWKTTEKHFYQANEADVPRGGWRDIHVPRGGWSFGGQKLAP